MKIISRKKVSLRDLASPNPSRAATKAVKAALKDAYKDQKNTLKKAYSK